LVSNKSGADCSAAAYHLCELPYIDGAAFKVLNRVLTALEDNTPAVFPLVRGQAECAVSIELFNIQQSQFNRLSSAEYVDFDLTVFPFSAFETIRAVKFWKAPTLMRTFSPIENSYFSLIANPFCYFNFH